MVPITTIKPGDVVKIHNWHGIVLETNFDETGALSIIRVQTARNVFRGYGPEYIDVRLNAAAVVPATLDSLQREIQTHRQLLDNAVERMLETSRQANGQVTH